MTLLIQLPKFPSAPGVYTLFARRDSIRIPIYVGESNNVRRRLGEYIVAAFSATTDFIVGEAILYLQDAGVEIEAEIAIFNGDDKERKRMEEDTIDRLLKSGLVLLNRDAENRGFNYRTADKEIERKRLQSFVDERILPRFTNNE